MLVLLVCILTVLWSFSGRCSDTTAFTHSYCLQVKELENRYKEQQETLDGLRAVLEGVRLLGHDPEKVLFMSAICMHAKHQTCLTFKFSLYYPLQLYMCVLFIQSRSHEFSILNFVNTQSFERKSICLNIENWNCSHRPTHEYRLDVSIQL